MKKIAFIIFIVASFFSSCTKETKTIYEAQTYVEFDANVFNAPIAPYAYTVVTRIVPYGYASATTYPLITRASGTIKLRVNLVGPVSGSDVEIPYTVLTNPTPVSPNALAVEGTHFTTGRTMRIPANSTYGEITITILNPGVSSSTLREVHLQLENSNTVKAATTYNKIAVRISQS